MSDLLSETRLAKLTRVLIDRCFLQLGDRRTYVGASVDELCTPPQRLHVSAAESGCECHGVA